MCRLSWNLGASTSRNPQGLSRPVIGLLYLYIYFYYYCYYYYHQAVNLVNRLIIPEDLICSQWYCWEFGSSGIWRCVFEWVISDVWKYRSGFAFSSKHFKKNKECLECLTLNTKVLQPFVTPVTANPMTQRFNPEDLNPEWRFHFPLLMVLILHYSPLVHGSHCSMAWFVTLRLRTCSRLCI